MSAICSIVLLSGCDSVPHATQPAFIPKTDEQIKQESVDKTVAEMKASGASQQEIDKFVAHSKLSYEEQLKSGISKGSSPSETVVSLVSKSVFHCDLRRNSLKNPITEEYTRRLKRELVECISVSSRVITTYYYNDYISSKDVDEVKGAVDEVYLQWQGYTSAIYQNAAPFLQDQASLGVADKLRRAQYAILKEALKNSKKKA